MIDPLLVQGLIIIYLFVQLVIFTNFLIKKIFKFIIKFFKKRGHKQQSSPLKQVTEVDNNTIAPVVKEELGEKLTSVISHHTPFETPPASLEELPLIKEEENSIQKEEGGGKE